MPTIIISGIIAIILFTSLVYYGLKPYVKAAYHSFFIDFDIYTLIRTFQADFNLLDLNYTAISVAISMLSISLLILYKSHSETKENLKKHGIFSLVSYLFFYFIFIGFVWIGIIFDLTFRKKQKW